MTFMKELLAKKQVDVGKAVKLMDMMDKCNAETTELFRVKAYLADLESLDPFNEYLYNRARIYNSYGIKELEIKYGGNE